MRWFEWSARQLLAPFGVMNNPLLSTLLWLGLAIFTVALLVLTRTRWGQAKPISKCVVLSVFAHILLAIYAYGTSLFPTPPAIPDDTVFKLKIITTELDPQLAQTAIAASESTPPEPADVLEPALLTDPESSPKDSEPVTSVFTAPDPRGAAAGSAADDTKRENVEFPRLDQASSLAAEFDATEEPPEETPTIESKNAPADPVVTSVSPVPSATPPRGETQTPLPVTTQDTVSPDPDTVSPDPDTVSPDPDTVPPDPGTVPPDLDTVPPDLDTVPPDPDPAEPSGPNLVVVDRQPLPTPPGPHAPAAKFDAAQQTPRQRVARSNTETVAATPSEIPNKTTRSRYAQRAADRRPAVVLSGGGGTHTEQAVAAALQWLVTHQEADGHWDAARFGGGREAPTADRQRNRAGANADSGITGLALLALLGSGQTHLHGNARQSIQFGLEYLLRQQAADGNLGGNAGLYAQMYCHGIALLALGEAYAATDDQRLRPSLQRGVQFTLQAQHSTTGGWRYQPGDRGDTSQFGWQVMSLRTAQWAGIEVPSQTRTGMRQFLRSVSSTRQPGLASYRRGERPTPSMTAEALVCRFFLQVPRDTTIEKGAVELLQRSLPTQTPVNFYYWYYGSLGLFQLGGEPWKIWNRALLQTLLPRQRTDGPETGSWDPDSVWGNYGGRVYSTALATLCLQTYYRYPQMTPRTALRTPWIQTR